MGNYDDIQIPVNGQKASSSLFGHKVRDSIIDLDRRMLVQETSRQALIKRGRRITAKTGIVGSEVPILRVDDIPVLGGYAYRISTGSLGVDINPNVATPVATNPFPTFDVLLRGEFHPTAAPPATVSSPVLNRGRQYVLDPIQGPIFNVQSFYYPATDGFMSVLLSALRILGTYTYQIYADANNPMDLTIEFAGEDPGDTGVSL